MGQDLGVRAAVVVADVQVVGRHAGVGDLDRLGDDFANYDWNDFRRSGLMPSITKHNNGQYPDLCPPVTFSDPNSASAGGGEPVFVETHGSWHPGNAYPVGRLDSSGSLEVRGLHKSDVVKTRTTSMTVTGSCSLTQN